MPKRGTKTKNNLDVKPGNSKEEEEIEISMEGNSMKTRLRSHDTKLDIPTLSYNKSSRKSRAKVGKKHLNPKDPVIENNENKNGETGKEHDDYFISLVLAKLNFDIKLDPNVVDRYTNKLSLSLPQSVMLPSEGADAKRRKSENEDLLEGSGHLHSSNLKENQEPVVRPPLISPGKMVGYTPGGQRYELDLNKHRPKSFSSEYARVQFDDATKINARRMFHNLEAGLFVPDSLDTNIERRYFAEREKITKDAREYFEKMLVGSKAPEFEFSERLKEEHKRFLKTEVDLVNLNQFAVLKLQDSPGELAKKLQDALLLEMTPLMFLKHPILVETIERLSKVTWYPDVVRPARNLLEKIKGLFDVPKNKTFKEYFTNEVKKFGQMTKNMTAFDVFRMTDVRVDEGITGDDSTGQEGNTIQNKCVEIGDTWVPVKRGDHWIDMKDEGINVDLDEENRVNNNLNANIKKADSNSPEKKTDDSEGGLSPSESNSDDEFSYFENDSEELEWEDVNCPLEE